MNEGSLLKRTLVVTGTLVGISAAWVALVSIVLVTLVGHATSTSASTTETTVHLAPSAPVAPRPATRPEPTPANLHARATTKPNG